MIRLILLSALTLLAGFTLSTDPLRTRGAKEVSYPEHLTGAFTGGFGEPNCRSCHFDYELNPPGGSLSISGISENISSGRTMDITITVRRKELGRAGFQFTARFENGEQAGQFILGDSEQLGFTKAGNDSLQYIQHTALGSRVSDKGKNSWVVRWKSPQVKEGAVIFNVAANAANGDQSEFGDYIFVKEIKRDL